MLHLHKLELTHETAFTNAQLWAMYADVSHANFPGAVYLGPEQDVPDSVVFACAVWPESRAAEIYEVVLHGVTDETLLRLAELAVGAVMLREHGLDDTIWNRDFVDAVHELFARPGKSRIELQRHLLEEPGNRSLRAAVDSWLSPCVETFKPEFFLKCRKDAGLTQREVAKALGVRVATVSDWERGIHPIPRSVALLVKHFTTRAFDPEVQLGYYIDELNGRSFETLERGRMTDSEAELAVRQFLDNHDAPTDLDGEPLGGLYVRRSGAEWFVSF